MVMRSELSARPVVADSWKKLLDFLSTSKFFAVEVGPYVGTGSGPSHPPNPQTWQVCSKFS